MNKSKKDPIVTKAASLHAAVLPWPDSRRGGDGGVPAGLLAADHARGCTVRRPEEAAVDAEFVVYRLEEAGTTLLSMPDKGWTTRLRSSRLDVVRSAADAYGWEPGRLRPAMPDSAKIDRMDEALGWIALIPLERHVVRRIVGARALVSPVTERHLFSWRRLGALLGADHKAVQRWHAEGIGIIVAGLNSQRVGGGMPGGVNHALK
jgi:hypothetical protein